MGRYMSKFGQWTKAGVVLQALQLNLYPAFVAQIQEDGELILQRLLGHIEAQDLSWTPLAKSTIELKHGDTTIYVETGYLSENLEVRKIKAPKNGFTLFIGASAWKKTEEGVKLSDLMIWLEHGTDKIPPRPLIRPTWEEVRPIIQEHWREILKDLKKTGGDM
jgi:hypothetical protein